MAGSIKLRSASSGDVEPADYLARYWLPASHFAVIYLVRNSSRPLIGSAMQLVLLFRSSDATRRLSSGETGRYLGLAGTGRLYGGDALFYPCRDSALLPVSAVASPRKLRPVPANTASGFCASGRLRPLVLCIRKIARVAKGSSAMAEM